jgi:quercetin dioxygenase-like cupin family protein
MSKTRQAAVPTTQIENDLVIVTEWKFAPGTETTWHTHEYDYVVVPQISGKLLIESDTGEKTSLVTVGQSYFRPKGVKHNVVNNNEYEFTFIEIELK